MGQSAWLYFPGEISQFTGIWRVDVFSEWFGHPEVGGFAALVIYAPTSLGVSIDAGFTTGQSSVSVNGGPVETVDSFTTSVTGSLPFARDVTNTRQTLEEELFTISTSNAEGDVGIQLLADLEIYDTGQENDDAGIISELFKREGLRVRINSSEWVATEGGGPYQFGSSRIFWYKINDIFNPV